MNWIISNSVLVARACCPVGVRWLGEAQMHWAALLQSSLSHDEWAIGGHSILGGYHLHPDSGPSFFRIPQNCAAGAPILHEEALATALRNERIVGYNCSRRIIWLLIGYLPQQFDGLRNFLQAPSLSNPRVEIFEYNLIPECDPSRRWIFKRWLS